MKSAHLTLALLFLPIGGLGCVGVARQVAPDEHAPDANRPDSGEVGVDASSAVDSGTVGIDVPEGTDAYIEPPPTGTAPRDNATVYFVGHSLVSHRDMYQGGAQTIPEVLSGLARSGGQAYSEFLHTTPGAPMSWNWNEVGNLRREIETNASRYDTMVVTEGVFLDQAYMWHQSPFYARRFFCSLVSARPDAELFVYETWHHVYGTDPDGDYDPPHVHDWRQQLRDDRPRWERIADEASTGRTPTPDSYYGGAGDCSGTLTVRLIPAGTALGALYDRIEAGEDFGGLTIHTLIQNGYSNWPNEWPVPASEAGSVDWRSRMSSMNTVHSGPVDDIHHGAAMAYYVGLVMYATIYRRNPTGLPAANGVSAPVARRMQELVWQVVTNDSRTGVVR